MFFKGKEHTFVIYKGIVTSPEWVFRKFKPSEPEIPASYLTFSSAEPFTIGVNNATKNWDGTLYYSTDGSTWDEWDGTTAIESEKHGADQRIYMRGSGNSVIARYANKEKCWVLTGSNISCNGNIENLLDFDTVENGGHPKMAKECYAYMFMNCTSLVTPPELPATTLADACYFSMFEGCTSLTTAPELPATTLTEECYSYMFANCTSLVTAPKLSTTTLAEYCYAYMFMNCTSLVTLTELPATTLADHCYCRMFDGCTSIKLSATQSAEYPNEYRIPTVGTGTTAKNPTYCMFANTGNYNYATPEINTTYYTANEVV